MDPLPSTHPPHAIGQATVEPTIMNPNNVGRLSNVVGSLMGEPNPTKIS
jgi:hypothetical protein